MNPSTLAKGTAPDTEPSPDTRGPIILSVRRSVFVPAFLFAVFLLMSPLAWICIRVIFLDITGKIAGSGWIDGLIGIGLALFTLLVGTIGWKSASDLVRWRKPLLLVYPTGLAFPGSSPDWLPWGEIKGVEYYDISKFPKFAIELEHPEKHIRLWRRRLQWPKTGYLFLGAGDEADRATVAAIETARKACAR